MNHRHSLTFAGAVVVAFIVVVVGATLLAGAGGGFSATDELSTAEFDPSTTLEDPIPVEGSVEASVEAANRSGTVVIDQGHNNDLERRNLRPLVAALGALNHSVTIHGPGDNLTEQLSEASAYVTITPTEPHQPSQIDALEDFTARGGRALVVGEPDQIVFSGPFPTQRTVATTELGARFGFSIDTRYLYNLERNDAIYKHVIAEPADGADLEGVDRTTVYTGTAVTASDAQPLLVATEGTTLSDGGKSDEHVIALRKGNLIVVGDRTFMDDSHHAVADNEDFIAAVVEFLARGQSA
ncbi:MAG: DUF4350 domain-containing protein [Salinirussus sp.]